MPVTLATPSVVIPIPVAGKVQPTLEANPLTTPVTVGGDVSYQAATAAGRYRSVVRYSGDARNEETFMQMQVPPFSTCLASFVVEPATPAIAAQASSPVAAGGVITATATLASAVRPTGTVTFDVFGPDNDTCTGSPAFTSTNPVADTASSTSDPFTTTAPGRYRFEASYSGDPNNAAAGPTSCSDPPHR